MEDNKYWQSESTTQYFFSGGIRRIAVSSFSSRKSFFLASKVKVVGAKKVYRKWRNLVKLTKNCLSRGELRAFISYIWYSLRKLKKKWKERWKILPFVTGYLKSFFKRKEAFEEHKLWETTPFVGKYLNGKRWNFWKKNRDKWV